MSAVAAGKCLAGPPLLLVAIALAACSERAYDAEGFVEAANAEGAGLELGAPLTSTNSDHEVRSVELDSGEGEEDEGGVAGEGEAAHLHSSGSITVTPGEEAARAEHARCESAVTLLCYRAGNVVLVLQDELPPEDRARVDEAIQGLESG